MIEEGPGSCGAFCGVEKFPQETLKFRDRDRIGREYFHAEGPGFFYFRWVYGHV